MSEFEGLSHAQLYAMVAAINPDKVYDCSALLTNAATTIEEIGNKLKDHRVKGWEGQAADAFQNWVNQTGSATLELAKYSANGGKYMAETAQIMREVAPTTYGAGNMPMYDAAAQSKLTQNLMAARDNPGNTAAVKLGQEAWSKLNDNHGAAVDAMTKLAGSYEKSAQHIDAVKPPTFPPPPDVLVPKVSYGDQDMARPGGESGGGGGSTGSSYTTTGSSHSTPSSDPGTVTGRPPQPDNTVPSVSVPSVPDREVDVDIDSVAVLPDRTAPPVTTLPGPLPTGPVSPTPGPLLPPMGFPPVGGMKPPSLTGPGIGPYPTLGGPGTPPPGGRALGTPGMPPRDSGITGGRPVTSTGPSSGIPRGNVIGEGTHAGRGMGGGMGTGVGGGHGGQNGFAGGRRLASEPGGIGGKPGMGARPIAGGQPFTQGGSGLVRNGARGVGTGAVGHAGARTQTPGKRRDDQQGERADYLVEDEETWQGSRRVVPPVID
ncbi:WXG100 family type VII secretion target [Streptomyces sp. NBC_00207]|uniref:WXG100 family type VII secretion target n=1 Tax=Streptomyces sp. NBC_00207 TaxID=2903635 RepID=UPI00324A2B6E